MVISRQRLTAPLTRGNMPEEHATEFTGALVEEVEREIEPLAVKTEVDDAISRAIAPLVLAIEDLRQEVRDLRVEMAALEARQSQRLLVAALGIVGVNFSMIAAAVGIILGFN